MFFFRHPRPVIDGRAVAVQVVQQRSTRASTQAVLVVETGAGAQPAGEGSCPRMPGRDDGGTGQGQCNAGIVAPARRDAIDQP